MNRKAKLAMMLLPMAAMTMTTACSDDDDEYPRYVKAESGEGFAFTDAVMSVQHDDFTNSYVLQPFGILAFSTGPGEFITTEEGGSRLNLPDWQETLAPLAGQRVVASGEARLEGYILYAPNGLATSYLYSGSVSSLRRAEYPLFVALPEGYVGMTGEPLTGYGKVVYDTYLNSLAIRLDLSQTPYVRGGFYLDTIIKVAQPDELTPYDGKDVKVTVAESRQLGTVFYTESQYLYIVIVEAKLLTIEEC